MSKSALPIARTIAATLERRIVDGTYLEGAQVKQADVAAEFGVSHIPVREALAALAQYGLLEISPNRGATVTYLSASQCMELADMRVALEELALKSSIRCLTDADLAQARVAIAKGQKSTSLEDRSKWNWAFHRALYARSERPFLQSQLEVLWRHADRYLRLGTRPDPRGPAHGGFKHRIGLQQEAHLERRQGNDGVAPPTRFDRLVPAIGGNADPSLGGRPPYGRTDRLVGALALMHAHDNQPHVCGDANPTGLSRGPHRRSLRRP
jgi:DNA-binding GntR family transcriptional regulator